MFSFFSSNSCGRLHRFLTFFVSISMIFVVGFPPLLLESVCADTALTYPGVHPTPLIDFRDIINVKGPDNTKAVTTIPKYPLELHANAVDAMAEDFITNGTSYNKASIFTTVTLDAPYSHTYLVCNRFAGYVLDDISAVGIPELVPASQDGPRFWYLSMSKQGIVQKAFVFTVFVNEADKTFTVNTSLNPLDIPSVKNTNYIFNFQIWAGSQQDAYNLMHNVISKLKGYNGWQLKFVNNNPVKIPFMTKDGSLVSLRVQNLLPEAQKVSVVCSIRYPADKTQSVSQSFDTVLKPGLNTIDLPFSNALDVYIQVKTKDFVDRTYVGSGYWFAFGKNLSKTDVQQPEVTPLAKEDFLLGSAGIKGNVPAKGGGGLDRTLNPNSLPVDISKYKSLVFWARGDGKSYSVQLETKAVRDKNSSDFHQFVITSTPKWFKYVIPLSSFKQESTDPTKAVPFTGTDVISAAWRTIGAPLDSVNLEVCNAGFTNQ